MSNSIDWNNIINLNCNRRKMVMSILFIDLFIFLALEVLYVTSQHTMRQFIIKKYIIKVEIKKLHNCISKTYTFSFKMDSWIQAWRLLLLVFLPGWVSSSGCGYRVFELDTRGYGFCPFSVGCRGLLHCSSRDSFF